MNNPTPEQKIEQFNNYALVIGTMWNGRSFRIYEAGYPAPEDTVFEGDHDWNGVLTFKTKGEVIDWMEITAPEAISNLTYAAALLYDKKVDVARDWLAEQA